MPRKKSSLPQMYALVDSSCLAATPVEVAETGTVRIALILEVISSALEEYPEARQAVSDAIASRLGESAETRILP